MTPYQDRIDRVIRHINANLAGDLSLDQLAEVAALSRFHFHRVYAAMTGENVADTVRRTRLNQAVLRLVTTDLPIATIGRECGYPNADSFVRVVTRAFGVTPRALRMAGMVPPPCIAPQKGPSIMYDVTIRDIEGFAFAGLLHQGAYHQVGASFMKMARMLYEAGLGSQIREGIGIYYDSPDTVAEPDLRAHAGCRIEGEAAIPDGLDRVKIPGGRTAVLTLKGPYSGIPGAWNHIYGVWLPQSGEEVAHLPPYEVYLNDMEITPPEELLTEIRVPLKS